jgi:hypothetical protein
MEEFSPRARARGFSPGPLGVVELSCNEIWRLFAAVVEVCVVRRRTGCAGRGGDASTRRALGPVTTGGNPPSNHEDHDLRLEC